METACERIDRDREQLYRDGLMEQSKFAVSELGQEQSSTSSSSSVCLSAGSSLALHSAGRDSARRRLYLRMHLRESRIERETLPT